LTFAPGTFCIGYDDLTGVVMNSSPIFCDVMPCSRLQTAGFLLAIFFDSEDGDDMFLRNLCRLSTDYTALYPETWKI
jgi:hypothetical protein